MEIQLKLTIEKLNTVLQALNNMPYGQVVSLINEIKTEAEEQIKNNELQN